MRTIRRRNIASLLLAILLWGLMPMRVTPQETVKGEILVRVLSPNGEIARIPPELVKASNYAEGPLILELSAQKPEEDKTGGYRFSVAPGEYYVRAGDSAGNFVRTYFPGTPNPEEAKPIHVSSGEHVTAGIHLSSTRKFKITGRIVDLLPDREPHYSPGVSLLSTNPIVRETKLVNPNAGLPICCTVESAPDVDVTVSVSNGRFEIAGVRAGEYELIGQITVGDIKPGEFVMVPVGKPLPYSRTYTERIPVRVTDGDITDLTVEVTHGVNLNGQFVSKGKRLDFSMTALFFSDAEGGPGPRDFTMALKDGRFVISNLAAGSYRISIGALPGDAYIEDVLLGGHNIPGGKGASVFTPLKVSVQKGDTNSMRVLVNTDGGTISGKINGGREASLTLAPIEEPSANAFRSWRESTPSGDFKFSGIPPGSYRVYAFRKGSMGARTGDPLKFADEIVGESAPVTVKPGGRVDLRLNLVEPK